jgi:hypothetical protein
MSVAPPAIGSLRAVSFDAAAGGGGPAGWNRVAGGESLITGIGCVAAIPGPGSGRPGKERGAVAGLGEEPAPGVRGGSGTEMVAKRAKGTRRP